MMPNKPNNDYLILSFLVRQELDAGWSYPETIE